MSDPFVTPPPQPPMQPGQGGAMPPMGMPPAPPPVLHDVKVKTTRKTAYAKVMPIPPEEFGIARGARTLKEARYCFHEVRRYEADLIADGYDEQQVKALPTFGTSETPEQLTRDNVERYQMPGSAVVSGMRQIVVTEHYLLMDYDGDGVRPWRVTTGGKHGEILLRDGKEEIYPVDEFPFAAMTPVPITHRFWGRSIADLVSDIQRIKTALLRGVLNNTYLANNPRPEIAESHTGESTLDDLLVWRPGAPIRTKQPGGLIWQEVPPIANQVFPVIEYMDATREWRTGVTRQGQGIDANALQNQSATAVNQAHTAAQARMKLIARIFAETGIRDLFSLLHATIRKNDDASNTVQLRNKWVNISPRDWKRRDDLTINVGLGDGGKAQRLMQVMQIAGMQKEAMMNGLTNLVGPENLYNTAKEVVKLSGLHTVQPYFKDPKNEPPPEPKPDPKMEEVKGRLQIEQVKTQAQIEGDKQKTAAQAEADMHKMGAEYQLKREQMIAEMSLKREQMMMEMELKREEMALKARMGAYSPTQSPDGATGIDGVRMGGEVG